MIHKLRKLKLIILSKKKRRKEVAAEAQPEEKVASLYKNIPHIPLSEYVRTKDNAQEHYEFGSANNPKPIGKK